MRIFQGGKNKEWSKVAESPIMPKIFSPPYEDPKSDSVKMFHVI